MLFKIGALKNFEIKVHAWRLVTLLERDSNTVISWRLVTLLERDSNTVISCEYIVIFCNSFFYRTPMVVASGNSCLESNNEFLDSYFFQPTEVFI